MQSIYIKCIATTAATTAPTGTTKKVPKPYIFSPSSGATIAAPLCSALAARLLKFDGRMTFLSYFCQPDNVENNHEDNASDSSQNSGATLNFEPKPNRWMEPEIKPNASDNLVVAVRFGG